MLGFKLKHIFKRGPEADMFKQKYEYEQCPVLKHGSPKMISKVNKQINPKRV